MLASRASSAFVCIRCKLRLAQPRILRSSRRPPHANFSITTTCRDALDVLDVTKHDKQDEQIGSGLSELHKPSFKFKKGKTNVIERTELLRGVKALGKDAEILVLQNVGGKRRDTPPNPPTSIISEAPYTPQVLASLQAQKSTISPEEIQIQIASFCPRTDRESHEPHYITQAEFLKLTRKLQKSFTSAQLSRYYSSEKGIAAKSVRKELLDKFKPEGGGKNSIDRTVWHPGTTSITRRLPGLWEEKHPRGRPASKPLLVDQILRDVWGLVLLEEIEASGELELTLKQWQLFLLSMGDSNMSALDEVKRSRKVKIEIFEPHNVLRITANKSSAEYAANDIEQMLQETESKIFKPNRWQPLMQDNLAQDNPPGNLSLSDLQFASSISGTSIKFLTWPDPKQKHIKIRGLNRNAVADAERTLINLLPITTKRSHTIDIELLKADIKNNQLVPYVFTSTLDYRSRRVPLGRWTRTHWSSSASPTRQAGSTGKFQPESKTLTTLKDIARSYKTPIFRPLEENSDWTTIPDIKWAAEFGTALFPTKKGGLPLPSQKTRSVFSPLVPGMAKTMTANDMRVPGQYGTPFLEYEFIPCPVKDKNGETSHIENYPRLQLRMQLRGVLKLTSLRVYFNERYHDVLLPDQVVDIRFKFHDRIRLRTPLANPKIRQFVDEICVNIQSGAKLTTPPLLDIDIPTWILPGYQNSDSRSKTVTYMFSHVNHREFAELKNGGIGRRIDSIQGSKTKSKHTQVSTYFHYLNRPVRDTSTPDAEKQYLEHQQEVNEKNINDFVRTTFDMVARFTEATNSTLSMSGEAARWTQLSRSAVETAPVGEENISNYRKKGEDAIDEGQLSHPIAMPDSQAHILDRTSSDGAIKDGVLVEAHEREGMDSNPVRVEPAKSVDTEVLSPSTNEKPQMIEEMNANDVSNDDKKALPLST